MTTLLQLTKLLGKTVRTNTPSLYGCGAPKSGPACSMCLCDRSAGFGGQYIITSVARDPQTGALSFIGDEGMGEIVRADTEIAVLDGAPIESISTKTAKTSTSKFRTGRPARGR